MAVINIRKDGTVVEDMSKVVIPKETIEQIMKIKERMDRENGNDTGRSSKSVS